MLKWWDSQGDKLHWWVSTRNHHVSIPSKISCHNTFTVTGTSKWGHFHRTILNYTSTNWVKLPKIVKCYLSLRCLTLTDQSWTLSNFLQDYGDKNIPPPQVTNLFRTKTLKKSGSMQGKFTHFKHTLKMLICSFFLSDVFFV